MEEKIYQNFDQPQDNPLEIIPEKKIATSELKPINKLSLSPKITLLIILGAIIFVLFLLSLVITQSRNSANKSTNIIPSITPVPTVTDSNTNYSLIPSPYQIDFQKINNYSSQDLNLPIPQIDTTVGQ
jgi:hypothetical protein